MGKVSGRFKFDKRKKTITVRLSIPLLVFFSYFLVSCDEAVAPEVQDEILGLWEMHSQSGELANICDGQLGELAEFTSSGVAYFQCPGAEVTYTDFSCIENTLTYTKTGVQYSVAFPNDTNMILTGINFDRRLTYSRNIYYN